MKSYDLLELAGRNLREAVLRNSLTTAGIAVGIASLVAMLSLGAGLQRLAHLVAVHGLGQQLLLLGILGVDRHALAADEALHVLADRDDDLVERGGMDLVGDFAHPPLGFELGGKFIQAGQDIVAGLGS